MSKKKDGSSVILSVIDAAGEALRSYCRAEQIEEEYFPFMQLTTESNVVRVIFSDESSGDLTLLDGRLWYRPNYNLDEFVRFALHFNPHLPAFTLHFNPHLPASS